MKPTIAIGVAGALLLFLAACGSAANPAAESAPTTTAAEDGSVPLDPPCGEELVDGETVSFTPCPDADPGESVPTMVEPSPGLVDLRPVAVDAFQLDETSTALTVTWWSGPSPCSTLDHVDTVGDGGRLLVTVWEGSVPGTEVQACPEIAVWKSTVVSLTEPADGIDIVDGAVTLGDAPQATGNVTLYVSNQSFTMDPVDIAVWIDDELVVDEQFFVGNQHNWVELPLSYPAGTHELVARSASGPAELVTEFTVEERLFIVIDFWGGGEQSDNPDPQLTFYASEQPIGFA